MFGWTGYVPGACDRGMVIVPITQTELIPGWPNRFLTRMREHGTDVILIGRIDGLSGANFSRLDTIEELDLLPPGFDGFVWTDHIENVGPRLRERWQAFKAQPNPSTSSARRD
jgi:glycerophosphoryl diester phosphodiesterase